MSWLSYRCIDNVFVTVDDLLRSVCFGDVLLGYLEEPSKSGFPSEPKALSELSVGNFQLGELLVYRQRFFPQESVVIDRCVPEGC